MDGCSGLNLLLQQGGPQGVSCKYGPKTGEWHANHKKAMMPVWLSEPSTYSVALRCRDGKTIVFFSTKHSAHRAKILFGLAGLPPSAELHGNMTQAARLESLERFRKVSVQPLLCSGAVT